MAIFRVSHAELGRGIEKLKHDLLAKWSSYKALPKSLAQGVLTTKGKSRYGSYLQCTVEQGRLKLEENTQEIRRRENRFGKSLIFSNMLEAESGFLIDTYHEKNVIEDHVRLLKDDATIRFRPIRHWTDTKIRMYALCRVVARSLMRFMPRLMCVSICLRIPPQRPL